MPNRRRAQRNEIEDQREAEHPRRRADGARPAEAAADVHPLLGLQASAGNAAVRSLLDGSGGGYPAIPLQGLWDTDDEVDEATPEAAAPETDGGVEADEQAGEQAGGGEPASAEPATEGESATAEPAQDGGGDTSGAIDQVEAQAESDLDPGRVISTLAPFASSEREVGDFEAPRGDTVQALAIQRDPADGEAPPPRAGTPGDILKALMPFLEPALERLKADVLATLRRLRLGEKIAVGVVLAPIVLAPLTQPGPRRLALDQLNGTDVTFGLIPNLKIAPSISDGQLRGGTITYDLAPALRSLGVPF